FVASLAITVDPLRSWAGSLAYETAVLATEHYRLLILAAVGIAAVLAVGSRLAPHARPASAKLRVACGALSLSVSTYWLAFEGGCPLVWRRGGMWNAPVDARLVVAAFGVTSVAFLNLWSVWRRRSWSVSSLTSPEAVQAVRSLADDRGKRER